MKAARILREKIASGAVTTGVLATDLAWPGLVEILHRAGIDYLIVDQEHGAHNDAQVAEICALGRLIDFPVLLRAVDTQYATVRRAIDRGPCGLMLPSVASPEELDRVRDSIYMPPRGKRRPGGPGTWWVQDFQYETWKTEVEAHFIVLPQIETKTGLANADAIAAHEITTAIAIGPYDLSAELGVCWHPESSVLQDAIDKIRRAGQKAGKPMWHIGDGPDLVRQGFTFICIGEPIGVLMQALTAIDRDTKTATNERK